MTWQGWLVVGVMAATLAAVTVLDLGDDSEADWQQSTTDDSSAAAACRRVASIAGDVDSNRLIDFDEFHDRLVDMRDYAEVSDEPRIARTADSAVGTAVATRSVSLGVLDPVAEACVDLDYTDV